MTIAPAYSSILDIQAYQTGKPIDELSREYGVTDIVKLASNENPLGCSAKVTLAITQQLDQLARYPDGHGYYLKQAIAEHIGCNLDQLTLGNGSNDLLDMIARSFVSCNDAVVYSQYAFVVYQMVTKMQGATGIETPAKHYGHDLDAMLDAIKQNENCKLVYIANPNNPTGTLLPTHKILKFLQQLKQFCNTNIDRNVLVVLDEAYVEYSPQSDNQDLLKEFDNLIIVRTFSKAYGLAGLRVGYAISHPSVADMINRIRQPFNVSRVAQATARAALSDQQFIQRSKKLNHEQMQWLTKQFDALGLGFVESHANFIMVEVGQAQQIYEALLKQGVIVRPLTGYGLNDWLRISIGLPEDNSRLIDTLRSVLTQQL